MKRPKGPQHETIPYILWGLCSFFASSLVVLDSALAQFVVLLAFLQFLSNIVPNHCPSHVSRSLLCF